jgi:hypothetical protein
VFSKDHRIQILGHIMSRSRSIDDVKVNQKIDWFKMIDKGDATEVSLAVQYIQIARECLSRRHEEFQVLLYVSGLVLLKSAPVIRAKITCYRFLSNCIWSKCKSVKNDCSD